VKYTVLIAIISLLAGLGAFAYSYTAYDSIVATRPIVTASTSIPPGTVILDVHLVERELPRGLEKEPIYTTKAEVVGKIAKTYIPAGSLIYRESVGSAEELHYASPEKTVFSIPIEPQKALGGNLLPGQNVSLYKICHKGQEVEVEEIADKVTIVDVGKQPQFAIVAMEPSKAHDVLKALGEELGGKCKVWVILPPY